MSCNDDGVVVVADADADPLIPGTRSLHASGECSAITRASFNRSTASIAYYWVVATAFGTVESGTGGDFDSFCRVIPPGSGQLQLWD
jgi:hypothetical protein